MFLLVFKYCLLLSVAALPLAAQRCAEEMLLDGSEPIVRFDADSTGHWWAVTQPFEALQYLWVDGTSYGPYALIDTPVFSPDGTSWACAVAGVDRISRLITNERISPVDGTGISHITFAFSGTEPWFVEHNVQRARITNGLRSVEYDATNIVGPIALDPFGTTVWYQCSRGNGAALVRNGVDVLQADEVRIGGVWSDGRIVAALRYGMLWSIVLGSEELATNLTSVQSLLVNQLGTVLCAVTGRQDGQVRAMMYSDEFIEPWFGPALESVTSLVLNPWLPIVAYLGVQRGQRNVYYNTSAYPAGQVCGPLTFSHDGTMLMYMGRDDVEFIAVDGKRHIVNNQVNTTVPLSIDPISGLLAYSTPAQMVVRNPTTDLVRFARLCDTMGKTVFLNVERKFVALGTFGQRLFRITCRP